ncbi:hypothetical protein AUTU_40310 (plasmid) [Aureibacter tunicatorum]|nr:hypothetical protein AUTU_40310 [Aureibacter tunicatorum]
MISSLKPVLFQTCMNRLKQELEPDNFNWLEKTCQEVSDTGLNSKSKFSFSLISRRINQKDISFENKEKEFTESIHPYFNQLNWNNQNISRLAFLLSLNENSLKDELKSLCDYASVKEQASIYQSMHFIDTEGKCAPVFQEGIRTNVIETFDALALANPYPSLYLNESAWNQMILKSIFMNRPLNKIHGLEDRNNLKLAHSLRDYALERKSAGRNVPDTLWSLIEPFKEQIEGIDEIISIQK